MQVRREALCPALDFAPLILSEDDRLHADIELVMGYHGLLDPQKISIAWNAGLTHFPHLTGIIQKEESSSRECIVPVQGHIMSEWWESDAVNELDDLKHLSYERQSSLWVPPKLPRSAAGALWQSRLTTIPHADLSVIGIRVSHAVVDGAGLAWFIHHCTAAARGGALVPVCHDRSMTFPDAVDSDSTPPQGYDCIGESDVWSGDVLAQSTPVLVTVPVDLVMSKFEANSMLDARLRLAAWLCLLVAECQPQTVEVALWCDARGVSDVPVHYTGNAGCFLHFPLCEAAAGSLVENLRAVATRSGFARIAETYRLLKHAESCGQPFFWNGLRRGVLQLNLVPHMVGGTDFGTGLPGYAMLLSRNSSGIRIAFTPDGARLMIELSLADETNRYLRKNLCDSKLFAEVWCDGGNSGLAAFG